MKLLVFGATGKTGKELVKQALDQGYAVIAFTRNPSKLTVKHKNLEIFQGDIDDYCRVSSAIGKSDIVISTLGASSPFRYDPSVTKGLANILDSLKTATPKRFIYMSFTGVKQSRNEAGFVIKHIAPKLLSTEIRGHEERERMLMDSGVNWTIIRAATLTNGTHAGEYRVGENIKAKGMTAKISRADVADFILKIITGNRYERQAPTIMY